MSSRRACNTRLDGSSWRHEQRAGRFGGDHQKSEVWTIRGKCGADPEDVAGPVRRLASARGLRCVAGKHVVKRDHAVACAVPLDADEVPQRVLEVMHPVDVGQVDRYPTERTHTRPLKTGEVRVARAAQQTRRSEKLLVDRERGIDSDAAAAAEREAVTLRHSDLQISPWRQALMEAAQEVEVEHAELDQAWARISADSAAKTSCGRRSSPSLSSHALAFDADLAVMNSLTERGLPSGHTKHHVP